MKTAFVTHISDEHIVYFGLLKLMTSFYKYHPEIPLYVFGNKEIEAEKQKYSNINWYYLNPVISKKVAEEYDLVVHIDADSVVTDRLDEVLMGDYDVAIVRNNSDYGKSGKMPPFTLGDQIHPLRYANCGLVASTRKDFWDDWINHNALYYDAFETYEQDVMNLILRDTKYKVKLLDPIEKPLYYGVSNVYGDITHWDSWKKIQVINEKLYLDNKLIKILHNAGSSECEKLNFDRLFSPEVSQHLKKITNSLSW